MKNVLTYSQAIKELEELTARIEEGMADPDTLTDNIKRALELISHCRQKLRETETEMEKLNPKDGQ
jgi:exodeoxyribonuclease VII small subunit